jgi:hypothetical protein
VIFYKDGIENELIHATTKYLLTKMREKLLTLCEFKRSVRYIFVACEKVSFFYSFYG